MVLSHQYLFPAIHALRHLYHIQLHSLVLFHILFGSHPSDFRAFPLVEVCGWRILSTFLSWKVCRFEPPGIFLTDGMFPCLVQKDHSARKAGFPGLKGQTSRREAKHVSWGLLRVLWASLVAQLAKNLSPCNGRQETQVQSLGREDPLEEEMATHSRILAWRIPWTEEPGGPQSLGSQRVGHDWATEHLRSVGVDHSRNSPRRWAQPGYPGNKREGEKKLKEREWGGR